MIENRPILTFFSHLILVIGVALVALPVYVTFVASSLAVDEVLQSPMPMVPGSHLIENYRKVLSQGASTNVTTAPVGRMMFNSLVSALVIAIGKITISLLSAFAIVYFRFRFRSLAVLFSGVLADFRYARAAGRGSYSADVQGRLGPAHVGHLRRSDGAIDR